MLQRTLLCGCLLFITCLFAQAQSITPGASSLDEYYPLLKGKKVGIICNQSSVIGSTHIVDKWTQDGIKITTIFAPEHGFRGDADAGALIQSSVDKTTGIPIASLYGNTKKPTDEMMKKLDVMVFDIQDVGVRFYTYISTLQYAMEACGAHNIPIIVLDRPNPNGDYVDGPILNPQYKSFVGMQPVPIVYGMTIGEYAKMLIGEKWLTSNSPKLTVIPCKNYTHDSIYAPPIPPSPNLKTLQGIRLYPSLCLFEGTQVSVGRGTPAPFELFGSPYLNPKYYTYQFKPKSTQGANKPIFENTTCYGINLHNEEDSKKISLEYIVDAYNNMIVNQSKFFIKSNIDQLYGNDKLRKGIIAGMSADAIRKSWYKDLENFKSIRKKYLIYTDFTK